MGADVEPHYVAHCRMANIAREQPYIETDMIKKKNKNSLFRP